MRNCIQQHNHNKHTIQSQNYNAVSILDIGLSDCIDCMQCPAVYCYRLMMTIINFIGLINKRELPVKNKVCNS